MLYIELKCVVNPVEAGNEILIAFLAELEYDSFLETENGLLAYIPKTLFDEQKLKSLLHNSKECGFSFSYSFEDMEDKNWNALWESHYEAVVVDEQCYIRAPFHPAKPEMKYEIVIEPKMSFGTAHHETTAQMISYLLVENCEGKSVLDMGSGTGVLAILAAMRGAKRVLAIDNDTWAYENCKENVVQNNIHTVETVCGDADSIKDTPYDIVIANINRNILLQDMEKYIHAMKAGSILLLSGFYQNNDLSILIEEAAKYKVKFHSFKVKNEWVAARFVKKKMLSLHQI